MRQEFRNPEPALAMLFEGERAEAAKFRATTLGFTFGSKLDALNSPS
jgi:hypothetical protein